MKACKIVGSQARLAKIIGVTPGQVSQWINRGDRISYEHILAIEKASGGEVSRYQLAPQIKYFELKNGMNTLPIEPEILFFMKESHKKLEAIQKQLIILANDIQSLKKSHVR